MILYCFYHLRQEGMRLGRGRNNVFCKNFVKDCILCWHYYRKLVWQLMIKFCPAGGETDNASKGIVGVRLNPPALLIVVRIIWNWSYYFQKNLINLLQLHIVELFIWRKQKAYKNCGIINTTAVYLWQAGCMLYT